MPVRIVKGAPHITRLQMPFASQSREGGRYKWQTQVTESDDVSGSVSDSIARAGLVDNRTVTDSPAAPTETLTRLDALPRALSDDVSGSVSDSISRAALAFIRTVTDTFGAITETLTRVLGLPRTSSDNISGTVSDSLSRQRGATRTLTDTFAAMTFSFTRQRGMLRTPSDDFSASFNDTVAKISRYLRSLSDPGIAGSLEPVTTYGGGFLQCVDVGLEAVHGTPFLLFGGDVEGIWKSLNHGASIKPTAADAFFAFSDKVLSGVKVSTKHAGYCYGLYGQSGGGLAYSSDLGASWSQIAGLDNTNGGSSQPRSVGKLIAIQTGAGPMNDRVYVGINNGIAKSDPLPSAFASVALQKAAPGENCALVGSIAASALPQTVQVSGLPTYWATGMSVKIDSETIQITVVDATHISGIWSANHSAGKAVVGQGFRVTDLMLDPNDSTILYATFTPANGVAGGAVFRISGLPGSPVVTLMDASVLPAGLLAIDQGGATAVYVASDSGIRRCSNPTAATPTWSTISSGITDGATGATFDNSSAIWTGIDGWFDGTHTHLLVAACPGSGYVAIPSSTLKQVAWRIDSAEASATGVLVGGSLAARGTTIYGTADTWWFALVSPASLFGGGSYAISEVRVDPNNHDVAYFSGRAGAWICQNLTASAPSVNPCVQGFGGTYNQHAAVDPQNNALMILGDTDWTLLGHPNRFSDAAGIFHRGDYVPAGANNGVTDVVTFDTSTNPSGLLVGGGNRNANNFGYIKFLAGTPTVATGAITDEAPTVGAAWPGGKSGDSGALRCLAIIQGLDLSADRFLVAIADSQSSTGGPVTGYGIVRKVGAPGTSSWTLVDPTFQCGSNLSPALAFVQSTGFLYAFDVINKRVRRSGDYGVTWSTLWTTTDLCDGQGQGFLAADPTGDRIYVCTRAAVYRFDTASGTPTITPVGTGVISNPGIVAVDANGAVWVTQISTGLAGSTPRAFWRSADLGATWQDVSSSDFRACTIWPNSFVIAADGTALLADSGQGGWVGNPLLTTYSFTPTDALTFVRSVALVLVDTLAAITQTITRALAVAPQPSDTVAAPSDSTSRASQSFVRSITSTLTAPVEVLVRDLHLHSGGVSLSPLISDTLDVVGEALSRLQGLRARAVADTIAAPSEVALRVVGFVVTAQDTLDSLRESLGRITQRLVQLTVVSRTRALIARSRDRILQIRSR